LGAHLAMELAIEDAQINTNEVQYINAHATSTGVGDISEINAITNLFKEHSKNLFISAPKSITGHLLGGAGAIEGILTALTVKNDVIPPTINTKNVDEKIANFKLCLATKTETTINYAISNSFGFGGHCASILFKKYSV